MGTSAGRTVTGRDEFKPIQKWHNKSNHPSQVLLLKYHTQQTLEIMERCSGESNKPVKRVRVDPGEIVDLTEDENAPRIISSSAPATPSSAVSATTSAVVPAQDEVVNEDVTVVQVPKQVPLLDISDEQTAPEWSFTSV